MDCWGILGLKETNDKKLIKRAYSKKLKVTRPEDDAEAYQALREAYDRAIKYCAQDYFETDYENSVSITEGIFDESTSENFDEYKKADSSVFFATGDQKLPNYSAAQEAVDELFSLSDEQDMIALFDSWLTIGKLSNLKIRNAFSSLCFEKAVRVDQDEKKHNQALQVYPVHLYRHLANEFEWLTTLQSDIHLSSNQDVLLLRFESYERYQELDQTLKQSSWFNSVLDQDYWLAKLILGPLRPLFFSLLARLGILNFLVRREILELQQARFHQVIPEVETLSFKWWENFLGTPKLSFLHFVYGSTFAWGLYLDPKISNSTGLSPWLFFLLCVVAATLTIYALTSTHFKLSTSKKRYFWYSLLAGLTCLMVFSENILSLCIFGVSYIVCGLRLLGFIGVVHVYLITAVSQISAQIYGFDDVAGWRIILTLIAITNYLIFIFIVPYMPRWFVRAASRTGFIYAVVVLIMTNTSLALITYVQKIF